MRRRTKLSVVFIVIVALYLVMPYLFGIGAQRYSHHFLQNENKTLGKVLGIHIEFAQYNRGWFRSTAVLQIEKQAADGNFEIVRSIPVIIYHGPSYRVDNRYFSGLGMVASNDVLIEKNSPYEISFRENIGFKGERGAFLLFSNKKDTKAGHLQVNALTLHMKSNLKADDFLFSMNGDGLHFQDPEKSITASVEDAQAILRAKYIGDRNWKLILGFGLGNDQVSTVLPDSTSTPITFNADRIDLSGVHFDTQKMATLLSEVVELKQASDTQQPVKPTAWMALLQQFLTQMIQDDTWADIKGLSITTPMGKLIAHYDVSFPTLAATHDYFDVATRNVSTLQVSVPNWNYTDTANTTFGVSGFEYDEYNNTVFSRRSQMTFGAFDVTDGQATTAKPAAVTTAQSATTKPATPEKPPVMYATGFTYQGELFGDIRNLSQTMQWQLAKFCFSDGCFNQVHGGLQLLKMNYDAFRGIANATQQVVQYTPQQADSMSARWMDLANAYSKLISPETQIILTHDMNTPEGKMALHGELSWPNLTVDANTPQTFASLMGQSVYEFHLLFPAAYVDMFLNRQRAEINVAAPAAEKAKAEPPFEGEAAKFLQYALSQGYLKKVGDAYVMDLTGKGSVVTINGTPWKVPG